MSQPISSLGPGSAKGSHVAKLVDISSLLFALTFFSIVLLAAIVGLTAKGPLASASTLSTLAGLTLVISASLACLLSAFRLTIGPTKSSLARSRNPLERSEPDGRILMGPILLGLFLTAVSGPFLVGPALVGASNFHIATALILTLVLGLPLLGLWAGFAGWVAFRDSVEAGRIANRVGKRRIVRSQAGLEVLPAVTLVVVVLVWVALTSPPAPRIVIDGAFGDWASIPGVKLGGNTTEIHIHGLTAQYEFARGGTYAVSAKLSDPNGNSAVWNGSVRIPNLPPVPSWQAQIRNLTVLFDGSSSSDPDGSVAAWDWFFGDGASAQGVRVNHTYPWSGNFTATLLVVDNENAIGQLSSNVTVTGPDYPPIARIQLTTVGSAVTASGAGSYDPDGGRIVNYSWSWGDGSAAYGAVVSHLYGGPGTYSINLQVRETSGLSSNSSALARVPNEAPIPAWSYVESWRTVAFNASGSSDPDGSVVGYSWDFGDGYHGQGAVVSHTYASPEALGVNLMVTDNQGASANLSRVINVTASGQIPPPEAQLLVNHDGLLVTADGSSSTDPAGSSLQFFWTFGDGGTGGGRVVQHLYAAAGVYSLGLQVVTSDGRTGGASAQVNLAVNRTDVTPPTPRVQVRVSGNVATFDATASFDAEGETLTADWGIAEVRPDLGFVQAKSVTSADHFFIYFELGGAALPPFGAYRVLLDTGGQSGFPGVGVAYSYEVVLSPESPSQAALFRYSGGIQGFNEWVQISSISTGSDGTQWELSIPLSLLLRPGAIGFTLESEIGSGAVVSTTLLLGPYGTG